MMKPFAATVMTLATLLAFGCYLDKPVGSHAGEPGEPPILMLKLADRITLKLARIPAGTFLMGSPETEKGRYKDEIQHQVTISSPFYLGITDVTVDQFAAFVQDTGYQTDVERQGWSIGFEIKDGNIEIKQVNGCSWRNPSFKQKGDHPVVNVTWNDANAFCNWLSKKSGNNVALPTEAQWEYACRAGSTAAHPWGDDDGKEWMNCGDQSLKQKLPNADPKMFPMAPWDDGYPFTSPVAKFKANAFGLYDMNGNVWQWCRDTYKAYEKVSVVDPTGGTSVGFPVLRGGSWMNEPAYCRSDNRRRNVRNDSNDGYGFRVVVLKDG